MFYLDKEEPILIKNELKSIWVYLLYLFLVSWAYLYVGVSLELLGFTVLSAIFSLHTLIDLRTFILPDRITYLGILLGAAAAPYLFGHSYVESLLGFAFGFGLFWLIGRTYEKLKGCPGLGFGDVKLLGMLGLWCGVSALPLIILIGSFSGLLILILRTVFLKKGMKDPLPFGPFLCLGGWVSLLYEPVMWQTIFMWREQLIEFLLGAL